MDNPDMNEPFEIGRFLTPVNPQPPIQPATIETLGRNLLVGQVIDTHDRHREIVSRTDTQATSGPLPYRHQITLKLVDLFNMDKEKIMESIIVRPNQKLQRVNVARDRYSMVRFALRP